MKYINYYGNDKSKKYVPWSRIFGAFSVRGIDILTKIDCAEMFHIKEYLNDDFDLIYGFVIKSSVSNSYSLYLIFEYEKIRFVVEVYEYLKIERLKDVIKLFREKLKKANERLFNTPSIIFGTSYHLVNYDYNKKMEKLTYAYLFKRYHDNQFKLVKCYGNITYMDEYEYKQYLKLSEIVGNL